MYLNGDKYSITSINFLTFIFLNSALCVFIFMSVEIFKGIIYTGYPYLNLDLKIKAKYKKNVLLFWVFGNVFNMLLCSLMLISSSMTGHSYSTIEDFLGQNILNLMTFFIAMGLDVFFSEIVNVIFILDNTFIEAFDPEEVARESSLLMNSLIEEEQLFPENSNNGSVENMMARTFSTLQSTLHTTFNRTQNATLEVDDANISSGMGKRRKKKSEKIHVSNIKIKDIEIDKNNIFERGDGLGMAYLGILQNFKIKVRQIALKEISSFVQR